MTRDGSTGLGQTESVLQSKLIYKVGGGEGPVVVLVLGPLSVASHCEPCTHHMLMSPSLNITITERIIYIYLPPHHISPQLISTSSNTPNLIIPAWPGQRNNTGPSYLLANKIKISGLRQIELLESSVELTFKKYFNRVSTLQNWIKKTSTNKKQIL